MLWDFCHYILAQWKILLLLILAGAFLGYYIAKNSPTTYKTKLTFMVNEQEGGSSGVENLLGNLGFDRPSSSQFNLPKILELSRSMYIIRQVLLSKVEIDGQEDFFANHFIREYQLHDQWKNDEMLADFLFQHPDFNAFKSNERKALKIIHSKIVGTETVDGAFTNALSNDSQIMTLSIGTPSEDLSVSLLLAIFQELSAYYVEKSTEKQRATYRSIQGETDSIQQKLKNVEYRLARFRDTQKYLIQQTAQLERNRLAREVSLYSTIYAESIKNLELAKFNLKQKTPFIQAIDQPFKPIFPSKSSVLKYSIIGAFAGFFFGSIMVLCYKIVVDAVRAERNDSSKNIA